MLPLIHADSADEVSRFLLMIQNSNYELGSLNEWIGRGSCESGRVLFYCLSFIILGVCGLC